MFDKEQAQQMAKNLETGFLTRMKTMDEKAFERYKERYPLLKQFLSMMWWKAKHDPEFEIDYSKVNDMLQKQYAYDQARIMEKGGSALPTPIELVNEMFNYDNMKEIKADESFVAGFEEVEKEAQQVEDLALKVRQKSERLWQEFNKKYKAKHKGALAFHFQDGKFFAVMEKGRE